ncbi:MAG: type IX secretion system sortase PorU [Cyclobacteriaceae bacterium]|nr:type IX secretion system sortase PorU [Cyclobacteriaceae bacterium]MCH8515524.1 type IX secretion system sortase PorU [Cyclobacteriaceae bacterium]
MKLPLGIYFFMLCFLQSFTVVANSEEGALKREWRIDHRFTEESYEHEVFISVLSGQKGIPSYNFKGISQYELFVDSSSLQISELRILEERVASSRERELIEQSNYPESLIPPNTKIATFREKAVSYLLYHPYRWDSLTDQWMMVEKIEASFTKANKVHASATRSINTTSGSDLYADFSKGNWWKISTLEEGVYRLGRSELEALGIDLERDADRIRLFSNGGQILPQSNAAPRRSKAIENPIQVNRNAQGRLTEILFYSRSADAFQYNEVTDRFDFLPHYYTDSVHFFLTVDSEKPGKRISVASEESTASPSEGFIFLAYERSEEINVINSGRKWYGLPMQSGSAQRSFKWPQLHLSDQGMTYVTSALMSRNDAPASADLRLNQLQLGTQAFAVRSPQTFSFAGSENQELYSLPNSLLNQAADLSLQIQYNPGGGVSVGYVEYLVVQTRARFSSLLSGRSLFFSGDEGSSGLRLPSSSFQNGIQLWDVTELSAIYVPADKGGFQHIRPHQSAIHLYAWSPDQLKSVSRVQRVRPQNIRQNTSVELLIVTAPSLRGQAQRLAAHRSAHSGLAVAVVTVDEIYNEFSGGSQDLTAIRDYARFLYQEGGAKLKYLLLFGRGSFDYKGIQENVQPQVPIYQSRNSLHLVDSYASDDYYGFLDDNEGDWLEGPQHSDHLLDLGVGRLPVRTRAEARAIVDKIIHYDLSDRTFGPWKNELLFIADDGDNNIHMRDAELMSRFLESEYPAYNPRRIYLDAFEQSRTSSGIQIPDLEEELYDRIDKGVFMINYTGHGSTSQLTDEGILTTRHINEEFNQFDRLPIMVTATCDFGKNDGGRPSGAELLLLKENGGVIAFITSTRLVLSSSNFLLNDALYREVFRRSRDQPIRTLGDVFMITKNNSLRGVRNRNFSLLGDPSMGINYPKHELTIEEVNGQALDSTENTIGAFQRIELSGSIKAFGSELRQNNFKGELQATIYDQAVERQTLGAFGPVMPFQERSNFLFKGTATVDSGRFRLQFRVPANLDYRPGSAKVSLYAQSEDGLDAHAGLLDLQVSGTNDQRIDDVLGPEIQIYFGSRDFQDGGVVSSNTLLIADFFDESGINLSRRGLGNEIRMTLNQDPPVVLNDFYLADKDSYQSGSLHYPLNDLPEGRNELSITARDNIGNETTTFISFEVKSGLEIAINRLYNYPNPSSTHTKIVVEHEPINHSLEWVLELYSMSGELIHRHEDRLQRPSGIIELPIAWGELGASNQMKEGVYIYKVYLKSAIDGRYGQRFSRMIVVN